MSTRIFYVFGVGIALTVPTILAFKYAPRSFTMFQRADTRTPTEKLKDENRKQTEMLAKHRELFDCERAVTIFGVGEMGVQPGKSQRAARSDSLEQHIQIIDADAGTIHTGIDHDVQMRSPPGGRKDSSDKAGSPSCSSLPDRWT